MAIEVVVDTKDSTKQIEAFAEALGELAQNADRLNSKLEFKNSIAQEFKAMRSVMSEFSGAIRSSIDEFKALGAGTLSAAAAMKSATAVADQVTQAIQNQTVSLKEHVTTLRSVGAEQERLNKSQLSAKAYLESQKTTQQKVREELQRFHKIAAENNITGREYARILEMITQKHKGAGLEIERTTQNLRNQVGAWGKTNVELLKMTSGWDLMSKRTQQNIIYLQKSADAQKVFSGYLKDSRTELQKHTDALDLLNKMRSNGFLKGNQNEQLYLDLKKSITAAIENERKAQEGLNNARAKHTTQAKTGDDYETAVRNLNKLRDSLYIIPKVATETEAYKKSVAALTAEQQKEHATLTQLQADMKMLAPLYQRSISPLEKYKQTVDAATRANQRYIATNGKMGISASTFTTITNKARLEFAKAQAATIGMNRGIFSLVGGFNTLTQATAAGRAAMIGAGQSFGIFEGRTIAVAASVYALARAIKASISAGTEFEYMTDTVSVLTLSLDKLAAWDGKKGTALGMMQSLRKETSFLRAEMVQLAQDTQFSSQEVAEAATILARSGQDAFDIYANLSPVLDLAAIAMTDMANAADIATGLLASFNDGSTTLEQAVDVLAVTSVKSKATIDDLGMSIQYIGPLAAQAGLSIEETAAILGVLADVNIRGTKAGTALRRVLINLQAPTEKAKAALTDLKIDYKNLELGEKGLQKVFEQMNRQGATMEQLRAIFGVYAISAATALTQLSGNIGEFNDELDKATGSASKMRDLLRTGLKMQFEELTSTMEAVQVTAFGMFGEELTAQISRLSQHIEDNRERYASWISETVTGLAEAVKWIIENINLLANLAKTYVALKVSSSIILGLVSYYKLLGVTAAGAGAAIRGTVASTLMATSGFGALSGVMAVTAGVARGLWIALGGPVGLAILGLTGLFYWLTKSSTEISDKFVPSLSSAGQVVDQFGDRLHTLPTEKLDRLVASLERDISVILPQQLEEAANKTVELNEELVRLRKEQAEAAEIAATVEERYEAQATVLGRLKNAITGNHVSVTAFMTTQNALAKSTEELKTTEAARAEQSAKHMELLDEMELKEKQLERARHASMLSMADSYMQTANAFKLSGVMDQYEFWSDLAKTIRSEVAGLNDVKVVLNMNFDSTVYEEVKARLETLNSVIKKMGEDSVYSKFLLQGLVAAGFKPAPGKSIFEALQDQAADLAEQLKTLKPNGPTGVSPEVTKAAGELKKYFDAYEKAKGPVYAVARDLGQVEHWMQQITSRAPSAMQALKEAGISIEEAGEALAWMKEDLTFQFLETSLGGIDGRFSKLRDTMKEVEDQELSVEEALRKLWETLNDPALAKFVDQMGGAVEVFNRAVPAVIRTADGSAKLESEWKQLKKTAAEFEVVIAGNVESLDDMVKKYAQVKGVSEEEARRTVSLVRAKEMLGDSLKKTADEAETLALAQQLLTNIFSDSEEGALRAAKAYNLLWASMPVGKLEAQNLQLKAQIALVGAGAREQAIYNAAVSEFGANWMYADEAFKKAAGSAYDLNYELERIEKIKSSYMEFGEGVIGVFADMFAGIQTSFSDMGKSIKEMFQKLLRDLIYLSLRNKIMISLGMEGPGSGSGGSSVWSWAQNFMSMLGGGKKAPNTGGATGAWSVLSSGASMASMPGVGFYGGNNFGLGGLLGGGGGSTAAGSSGSALSSISNIFSASTWLKAGKSLWQGFTVGSQAGYGSTIFGAGTYTPGAASTFGWAPTGLGYAGMAAGGVMGAMYGYRRSGNIAGAAGYGALGLGAAGGLMSLAGGTGFVGGMSGAFSAIGVVPVLGWIAAAAAIIDAVSGGKLFGTKYRPESVTSALKLTSEGAEATLEMIEVRNRSLFRGRSWRTSEMETTPEMDVAAQKFYNNIRNSMVDAANKLATDTPPMIDAALRTVIEYDKKGKETAVKYFVDVLGRTWEEETAELGASRITAEALIAVIDSAFAEVANYQPPVDFGSTLPDDLPDLGPPGREGPPVQIKELMDNISTLQGQASAIAERWRDDAEKLLEGANFLVQAAGDLRKGLGLLGDTGTLEQITDLTESLGLANETLSDTYTRIYQSTLLMEQALSLAGATTDKARAEFVVFSTEVINAMGGLDEATQKWNTFFQAFYSSGEIIEFQKEQMEKQANAAFANIGLSLGDFLNESGMADFKALFEEALPSLSPAQVAMWVDAGLSLVAFNQAIEDLTKNLTAIDNIIQEASVKLLGEKLSSYSEAFIKLEDDFLQLKESATSAGASLEQLSALDELYYEARIKLEQEFQDQVNAILSDNNRALFVDSLSEVQQALLEVNEKFDELHLKLVDLGASSQDLIILELQRMEAMERARALIADQLEDFMLNLDPAKAFTKLQKDMRKSMEQAISLGASEEQLSRIRKLQALEMAKFISDTRNTIHGMLEGLGGYLGLSSTIESNYDSSLDMATDLYELERKRYELTQKAIETISKYLMDLETTELAPGDWRTRLSAGRSNFDEMLELARAGDETALNEITRYADTLLKLGKETLGETEAYDQLYDYVTGALRDLMADLGQLQAPPDAPGGSGGTSGDLSGSQQMSPQEAYWAILDFAQQIAILGDATKQSSLTLLEEFGVPLLTLVEGLGVSLASLDGAGLETLSLLATALNTDLAGVLTELQVNPTKVAELLGLSLEDVRVGIVEGLGEFAEFLGITVPEALTYLGVEIGELAPAFGVYIESLTEGTVDNLVAMAEALGILPEQLTELLGIPLADIAATFSYEMGVSSAENYKALKALADAFGMSLFDLGTALNEDFSVIVGGLSANLTSVFEDLPEGIGPEVREQLTGLLENVASSANPKDVQAAVGVLYTFTRDNLPANFAEALGPVLSGLLPDDEGFNVAMLSRLADIRWATVAVNDSILSMTSRLGTILDNIYSYMVGPEEIPGEPGEGETSTTPTTGDRYLELQADSNSDDLDELYAKLEDSQEQMTLLASRLADTTEKLNQLQMEANDKLGKIVGNTRQTAKKNKETKSL